MAEKRIFDIETEATIDDITEKVYAWFDKKAQEGDVQEPSWKFDVYLFVKILNNFATKFVPNVATVEGKCYWHDGELFVCDTAYTGAWIPGNFTATTIDELFARKDVLSALQEALETTNGNVAALTTYAQNVSNSIAPEFDSTRTSENPYKAGETVMYTDGKVYTFKVNHYGAWASADVYRTNIVDSAKDILFGKKWYSCGDSYTAGVSDNGTISDDGPYNGYKAVYPYYIGNRTKMDVHNIAVAQMTLAYKENYSTEENCFSFTDGLYKTIPSDADYITLKFGINDYYQNISVGTIDDASNATLYGAWNVALGYIRLHCPRAKIGIIVSNRASALYSKAARDIALKWGVPFLDENFDDCVPLLNDVTGKPKVLDSVKDAVNSEFRISSSNIHPNDYAHYYESTIVENFLRSI